MFDIFAYLCKILHFITKVPKLAEICLTNYMSN